MTENLKTENETSESYKKLLKLFNGSEDDLINNAVSYFGWVVEKLEQGYTEVGCIKKEGETDNVVNFVMAELPIFKTVIENKTK